MEHGGRSNGTQDHWTTVQVCVCVCVCVCVLFQIITYVHVCEVRYTKAENFRWTNCFIQPTYS